MGRLGGIDPLFLGNGRKYRFRPICRILRKISDLFFSQTSTFRVSGSQGTYLPPSPKEYPQPPLQGSLPTTLTEGALETGGKVACHTCANPSNYQVPHAGSLPYSSATLWHDIKGAGETRPNSYTANFSARQTTVWRNPGTWVHDVCLMFTALKIGPT